MTKPDKIILEGSPDALQAARVAAACHRRGWIVTLYPDGSASIARRGEWEVADRSAGAAYVRALSRERPPEPAA